MSDSNDEVGSTEISRPPVPRSVSRGRIKADEAPVYWKNVWDDLQHNLHVARRYFYGLLAYVVGSTIVLYVAEHSTTGRVQSFWDALYYTWLTMATVGNAEAATLWGRLITAADALVGLITIGVIVWLVTSPLDQKQGRRGLADGDTSLRHWT